MTIIKSLRSLQSEVDVCPSVIEHRSTNNAYLKRINYRYADQPTLIRVTGEIAGIRHDIRNSAASAVGLPSQLDIVYLAASTSDRDGAENHRSQLERVRDLQQYRQTRDAAKGVMFSVVDTIRRPEFALPVMLSGVEPFNERDQIAIYIHISLPRQALRAANCVRVGHHVELDCELNRMDIMANGAYPMHEYSLTLREIAFVMPPARPIPTDIFQGLVTVARPLPLSPSQLPAASTAPVDVHYSEIPVAHGEFALAQCVDPKSETDGSFVPSCMHHSGIRSETGGVTDVDT
ncbi:hypothetical protein B0H10DRAFT_2221668 [Mycena sp. CBHHK59/15]|nr:hypothetical protein B0H10DRAFT_2221668 [Mycena sp. CBHHK59/15]